MPAKHPCAYYAKVDKDYEGGCEIGRVITTDPLAHRPETSILYENHIEQMFSDRERFHKFLMIGSGRFTISFDGVDCDFKIHRYCPGCGSSIRGRLDRMRDIIVRIGKFASLTCTFKIPS